MAAPRFWRENPSRYNLMGFKCNSCGRQFFPMRVICPFCHRKSVGKIERVRLSSEGTVFSFTEVHEGLEELGKQTPYMIAMVELAGGVRVTGQVADCDPCSVKIGDRVRVTLRKLSEEGRGGIIHYGYKFVPLERPQTQSNQ